MMLTGAVCLLLTQCAVTDPVYESLAAKAEASPANDAIVGMWHRKGDNYLNKDGSRTSYLIKGDGTGIFRKKIYDLWEEFEHQADFRWQYLGGGLWHLTFSPRGFADVRMSGELLLLSGSGCKLVYERVR